MLAFIDIYFKQKLNNIDIKRTCYANFFFYWMVFLLN